MEITKEIFLESRRKVDGITSAKVTAFDNVRKAKSEEQPKKVFLDVYGREIHVNGPLVASTSKPESLREKIERFDRLAERVRMSRAIMMDTLDEFDGPDEDPDDDTLLDDTPELDPFGDPIVAEPTPVKPAPAEPATKDPVGPADTRVDANGAENAVGDSLPESDQD